MPFAVALSGLNAASSDLNVTANNIANANTTGFKGSRAEFADVFAVGAQQIGNGVRLSSVSQEFKQGGVDFTDRGLDLAISGEGFFTVSDGGLIKYTRAGSFGVDRDGFVVNNQNERLQIFPVTTTGTYNTGTLSDLQLATSDSAPQATTTTEFGINLPADAQPPPVAVFDPNNASTYNHSTAITIYDSLGATHTATAYFVKTATPNQWDARFYIDGTAVGGANTMTYSNAGSLTAPATGAFTLPAYTPTTGAAPINLSANVLNSTQYGSAFGVTNLSQDGYAPGQLVGVQIESDGTVMARYSNFETRPAGQVELALFRNPQGLQPLGGNSWAASFASGDPLVGVAGAANFGVLQSGAVEDSNVDLTAELVDMITAQRVYQANAQTIKTQDQILQTIVNLR